MNLEVIRFSSGTDSTNGILFETIQQGNEIDAILYQMQLMQDDIDELRRYIVSAELLQPDTMGDSLPTSDPTSAGQLWNNRDFISISRG